MRLILLFTLVFSLKSFAQDRDPIIIKKISDEIMTNGRAYENLRLLCKGIGHRLAGTTNAEKSVRETARMLKEAGADTVYLQPCMVNRWIRGEKERGFVQMINGNKLDLSICALGNSVATGKNGIAGKIVEVTTLDELNRLSDTVIKGKIVFINIAMNPAHIKTTLAYSEIAKSRVEGPALEV